MSRLKYVNVTINKAMGSCMAHRSPGSEAVLTLLTVSAEFFIEKQKKYMYRSTSLSQSPREWRKYFEISEVRHSQNVTSPKYSIHVEFR